MNKVLKDVTNTLSITENVVQEQSYEIDHLEFLGLDGQVVQELLADTLPAGVPLAI